MIYINSRQVQAAITFEQLLKTLSVLYREKKAVRTHAQAQK